MKSKLVCIGNSFGVRLPRQALARAGLAPERPVSIRVARGRITIEADTDELAHEARRQSLRVSERPARDAGSLSIAKQLRTSAGGPAAEAAR